MGDNPKSTSILVDASPKKYMIFCGRQPQTPQILLEDHPTNSFGKLAWPSCGYVVMLEDEESNPRICSDVLGQESS